MEQARDLESGVKFVGISPLQICLNISSYLKYKDETKKDVIKEISR